MTRIVRRLSRRLPPQRGRLASRSSQSQPGSTLLTVFRQGLPRGVPVQETVIYRDPRDTAVKPPASQDIPLVLRQLHNQAPDLFKVLNRPWKWLMALVLLLMMAVMVGVLL